MLDTLLTKLNSIYIEDAKVFTDVLHGKRDEIYTGNSNLIKTQDTYSSLEDLQTRLSDGQFSIDIEGVHFECLFARQPGKYLYVVYNGARGRGETKLFKRWSYHKLYNGSYLGIDDPMCYKYDNLLLGWYFGEKERSYLNISIDIIHTVCKKLDIPYENIIFFSSSGGGYAGLYASCLINNSLSISLNPQLDIKTYSYAKSFENITNIILKDKDIFNRNDIVNHINSHSNSKHVIISNAASYEYDLNPLIDFCRYFSINNLRYGLNLYNNILIWIYDCNYGSPHNCWETKTLFSMIDFIAKEFKDNFINYKFEDCHELSIFTNEVWREIYIHMEKAKKSISVDVNQTPEVFILDSKDIITSIESITPKKTGKIVLEKQEGQYNSFNYMEFDLNCRYTIIIKRPTANTDITRFTLGLGNIKHRSIIKYIDCGFSNDIIFNFIVGKCKEGLAFRIYAGLWGKTAGQSLTIENMYIYKQDL